MKVGLLGALENSGARTDQLARQVLAFGQVIPMEEIARRVDAVTPEAVRAAATAMIEGSALTFAALGPKRGLDKAARLAEQFKP
jgi:predicted Zn-dependent peptidase